MEFEIRVSDHITLKMRTVQDAEDFFTLVDKNREKFRTYLAWVDDTKSVKEVEDFIVRCSKSFEDKTGADFGVQYDGVWIGSMGFHGVDAINKKAAIGYWLDADYEGRGIMTECVKAIISYGFETLDLNRIEILCATTNTKSRAIPERLGFTLEGTLRQYHRINGAYVDDIVFSLLKSEWQK
jgi:ribosomal-protein-serine acetyltransferase